MPRFRHRRTGRTVDATNPSLVARYQSDSRWEPLDVTVPESPKASKPESPPSGTVAQILAWAGDDPGRRAAALDAELAGKNRKGIIDALGD